MGISPVLARIDPWPAPILIHPVKWIYKPTEQRPLRWDSYIAFNELGQINIPKLECNRESEQINTTFVDFETFFEVFVFFEELCVIDDDLMGIKMT